MSKGMAFQEPHMALSFFLNPSEVVILAPVWVSKISVIIGHLVSRLWITGYLVSRLASSGAEGMGSDTTGYGFGYGCVDGNSWDPTEDFPSQRTPCCRGMAFQEPHMAFSVFLSKESFFRFSEYLYVLEPAK